MGCTQYELIRKTENMPLEHGVNRKPRYKLLNFGALKMLSHLLSEIFNVILVRISFFIVKDWSSSYFVELDEIYLCTIIVRRLKYK